ncbi:MAG: hypothetical protein AB7K64_02930 [Variibacter sp.]
MPKKFLPADDEDDERERTPEEWEAFYRMTCDFWKFWEICSEKPCKRARRCAGDVHLCRAKHLQLVTPEAKVWLQTMLQARRDGVEGEALLRLSEETVRNMGFTDGFLPAVRIPETPPQPMWPVEPGRRGR